MSRPARYPPNDSAETDAIVTFLKLIDSDIVKADIKERDKYPNIDGSIELVDQETVPLGKLEVQVKALEEGKRKFSCPTSLVAYSEVSTLPVLLICSDSKLEKVFWRHINPSMPEYKEDQKTFTIHFSDDSDAIDDGQIYIQKWLEITRDYQERIAQFPTLKSITNYQMTLDEIDPSDRILFQKYIDTINNLFDNDFISVKRMLYPGIWKFGVGLSDFTENYLGYQMYTIPYGETAPLFSIPSPIYVSTGA